MSGPERARAHDLVAALSLVAQGTVRKNASRIRPLEDRFRERVDQRGPDECWEWRGTVGKVGYGVIGAGMRGGKHLYAHRVSYELDVGPIPEGLTIDHLCRNRTCVNPAHLEPVTRAENVLRGMSGPAQNARKTHCKHGHPFDEANTLYVANGHRRCRTCQEQYDKARRAA